MGLEAEIFSGECRFVTQVVKTITDVYGADHWNPDLQSKEKLASMLGLAFKESKASFLCENQLCCSFDRELFKGYIDKEIYG